MSRLDIKTPDRAQMVVEQLYHDMERRIAASPPGLCPVDMALNFLNLCHAQTCGKCVPCRVGLAQLSTLLTDVLDGRAKPRHMQIIADTARSIEETASCAIGQHAAQLVLNGLKGFADDYWEHINHHRCPGQPGEPGALRGPVPGGGGHPRIHRPDPRGLAAPTRCGSSARTTPSPWPAPTSASTPARPGAAGT